MNGLAQVLQQPKFSGPSVGNGLQSLLLNIKHGQLLLLLLRGPGLLLLGLL